MAIDATAVARVLGIATEYKDMRAGNVLYLPQRIMVIAQGASDAVYSTTKFQANSAGAVGNRVGFGSPMHLIARQLFPQNGDGVGTVPVTFYPMQDAASGVAAQGSITPGGSQTTAGAYRVVVGDVRSQEFVIPVGASMTTVCRLIGIAMLEVLEMPVAVSYTYGTVTSATGTNTGNGTLTSLSVQSGQSPMPGAWTLRCTAAVANGGTFSLTDPTGRVVDSAISMTAGVGLATAITRAGLQFTLTDGTTDFAVNDSFTVTVPASAVLARVKWEGTSGNRVRIAVQGESLGTTFAIVQPTGGLVNPTVDAALAQVGNVWETLVINALEITDTTALDAFQSFGEGRWGQLVRKPLVVFTGVTDADVNTATTVSSVRRTDRVNAQLVSPGTEDLPFVVCARQVARIAKLANNNPPTDYAGAEPCTGLVPGADGVQWNYAQRDQAVKAGSSTIEVNDGVVNISDVVTFYRPTGEEPPAYRYVVDIVKIQNAIYNLDLNFASLEWRGAPLIPDDQPSVNPRARKPKVAKAQAASIVQSLGDAAILSDVAATKASITASIDGQNPKRLNMQVPVKLSGNTGIISVDLFFGFFFGGQAAA